jgi:hypothetical protein
MPVSSRFRFATYTHYNCTFFHLPCFGGIPVSIVIEGNARLANTSEVPGPH